MNMKVSPKDFPRVITEGRFLQGGKYHAKHFLFKDFASTKESVKYLLLIANFSVLEALF